MGECVQPTDILIPCRTVSSLEEIVEKQGDIIVYLKRHNALLSKRLLAFTSSDLGSQSQRK